MRLFSGLAAIALLGAAFGLGACTDMVISPTPVITAQESAQAPKVKPGFWAYDVCVDQREKARWPCTQGFVVSGETIDLFPPPPGGYGAAAGGDLKAPPFSYRIGVGDPLLVQVQLQQAGAGDQGRTFYAFAALDPISRDDRGRIDRAEVWLVKCGPPAEPQPGDMGPRPTEHPFSGVTGTEYGCRPTDRSGLVAAARASRTIVAKEVYRWIDERPPEQVGNSVE
jgi:hypothetical protein